MNWSYRVHDDIKAPFGRNPNSAMFSRAAFNIYQGVNLSIDSSGSLTRTAYGTGSGSLTVGLNPETVSLHSMSPDHVKLMQVLSELVKDADPDWRDILTTHPLNYSDMKGFFSFRDDKGKVVMKNLGFHADCTYKRNNIPMSNNSQVPGSITLVLTFGDPKVLWFLKHLTKKEWDPSTLLRFVQRHLTLFVLDGRDERLDENGMQYRHMSNMIHEENITFSIMFRCVKATSVVNADGSLVAPYVTSEKKEMMELAMCRFDTDQYKQNREELENRMRQFFQRYKP